MCRQSSIKKRMSRRKRRMTRRQWSSCSSKRSYSSFNYEQHNKFLCHCAVCQNGMAEKEKVDSFQMESSIIESDEGGEREANILFKEKQFRRNNYGETFKNRRRASISTAGNRERGLEIITSVMVNGRKVSRIVFRQSQDSTCKSQVHGTMAVTTTKVKYTGRRVKVETKEILPSNKSKFETFDTFTMHRGRRQRNKASSTKQWERSSMPDNNKLPNVYSPSQSSATGSGSTAYEEYQFRCVETDHDMGKDTVGSNYNEEIVCYKSCCDDDQLYDHHPMLSEGILSTYPVSEVCTQEKNQSPINVTCPQALSDIPPPHEFADGDCSSLEDLTQEIASCHITSDNMFHRQVEMHLDIPEYEINSSRHFSVQDFSSGTLFHQLSLTDTYRPLFMEHKMVIRRSSFDKDFILHYEGKCSVRNNSTSILEAKPRASYYLSKQFKRRKTFPGSEDSFKKRKDYLPLHTESFSSGILSPFFMQSLQLHAMASAQVDVEDERPFIFRTERRKSSESSTSHFESNSPSPHISSYRQTRNPYYLSKVVSSYENDAQHYKMSNENKVALNMTFGDNVHMKEPYLDKHRTGSLDQTETAESGFDEETLEAEEVSTEEPMMKDLLIHVTPSWSTSQDLLSKDGTVLAKPPWLLANKSSSLVKNRSSSVITIITGGSEQRHLHNDAKPADVSKPGIHQNFFSTVHEKPSASPVPHMEDMENNNDAVHEVSLSLQCSSSPTGTNSAVQTLLETHEVDSLSADETNTTVAIGSRGLERRISINTEIEESVTLTEITCSIVSPQDKLSTNKSEMGKTDPDKKQTFATTYLDGKVDALENLRPPEPALKDTEEARDRWAKRRKLFKESKQWSSAGGSSITSNITEESDYECRLRFTVNSENTRSTDLNMWDIEDRGFYTETFHSASWMYCGDEAHAGNDPGCLRKRPRPVTIRERTVRISKGVGEYPWGFRIQFSKPIVVTEVDTNGAAEEAGLQIGDYVLSVNGTDVSGVAHSEAAELARRGPDLLTLTIGSDISRHPNTPRPACRGYLHKRTQSGFLKGWRKRWFVLKHDGYLYYYRHKKDEGKSKALSFLKLEGADVEPDMGLGKPHVFRCCPVSRSRFYYYCATSNQEMKRWLEAMNRAAHPVPPNHVWVDVTRHNASLPPLAIKKPECLGLLHQLDREKDVWVQYYCILKDGCLYFYAGIRSTSAQGGIFLHGYAVREQPLGSKRSTIELKPPSEEFKTFYLCAENATENRRWILALKVSIRKWLPLHEAIKDYMKRPPEETRM